MPSRRLTRKQLKDAIRRHANAGFGLSPGKWDKTSKPLPNESKSPTTLYHEVKTTKKNEKNFSGHGSWDRFLEREIGVSRVDKGNMYPERAHSLIGKMLGKVPDLSPSKLEKNREPMFPGNISPSTLYDYARRSIVKEKKFFGYGSWYEYLIKVHKVSPTTPNFMPDARVHSYISRALDSVKNTGAKYWSRNKEPISPVGQSLQALYSLARTRKKNGINFFGFGSWSEYIEKTHGIEMQKYKTGKKGKVYSNEFINSLISEKLITVTSHDPSYWRNNFGLVSNTGQTFNSLYRLVEKRKRVGKPFMGHGTWPMYLEKVHGSIPTYSRNMPDARLNSYILRELNKGEPSSAQHWQNSTEPKSPAGHSLKALYLLSVRRKIKDKPFFGHGTWKSYITWLRKNHKAAA